MLDRHNPRQADPDRPISTSRRERSREGLSLKLLDQVREVMRGQHLAYPTEQPYVQWIERYLHHFRTAQG